MNPRQLPLHAPMTQFPVRCGELQVGGKPLSQLASEVGQTPFYAYERRLIDARVAQLRHALPAAVKLHYAIKANPMPAVVRHLAELVNGLDVASAGELDLALASGANPREISFAGPGKREPELAAAVRAGVLLNVESFREVELLSGLSQTLGMPARVAVRVNPDFELKSSGMKMGGGPKPFGVDAEEVPHLLQRIGQLDLAFEGFHLFAGSQNLRPEAIIEAQQLSYSLALQLAADAPSTVKTLNLGGGFGVPYFPGDLPLDLATIGANLEKLREQLHQDMPGAELVIELGRYLVAEAGIYVCRVIDRKVSRGQVFLVCDGGLHHHLAASGNFGQLIRKNYPVIIGNKASPGITERASIVGPLCTPLDILADRMELAVAEPGDLVVVFQSGAYGLSASPAGFLSHPAAAEVLV
jgi:diaminopimelate decarboxylase